jgi:DNA-directed RNA polymerase specialized sigma subunit
MDANLDRTIRMVRKAADKRTMEVRAYKAKGLTFAEIGKLLGISRQRAKQIFDRAVT